jgi:hypothetical protein
MSAPSDEALVRDWIAAYDRDPLLADQFPVALANGGTLPGVAVTCNRCRQPLPKDRVRGQVLQSLPHVIGVLANGYCERCDCLTHVACRFRSEPGETRMEWIGEDGRWRAEKVRRPGLLSRLARRVRRLLERFAPAA